MEDQGGWVGDISARAPFTAWKVVPGGVSGARLSMMRFVWLTMMRAAADIVATTAAITTGFRKLATMRHNVLMPAAFLRIR
jgi:hypothetical protein